MKLAYTEQSNGHILLYNQAGALYGELSGIPGSLRGNGSNFLLTETESHYLFVSDQGITLHTYHKEHGSLVSISGNGATFHEGSRFVTYDRNGIVRNVANITKHQHDDRRYRIEQFADKFITALIILNAIAAGAMTYLADDSTMELWLNRFCDISILIFVIEIAAKMFVKGREFFRGDDSGWNIFDLVVTIISSLSFFTGIEGLVGARAIRILRELRLLRVISGSSNMKRIFHALIYALPQISWTSIFFILLYYIYGIIGVEIFGGCCDKFATLHRTFLTLMQVMTFDDWMALTTSVMEVHPWAWIYFGSFVILAAYILVNLLVGIVVDSLNEVRENEEIDKSDVSRELSKLEKQLENVKKLMKNK